MKEMLEVEEILHYDNENNLYAIEYNSHIPKAEKTLCLVVNLEMDLVEFIRTKYFQTDWLNQPDGDGTGELIYQICNHKLGNYTYDIHKSEYEKFKREYQTLEDYAARRLPEISVEEETRRFFKEHN